MKIKISNNLPVMSMYQLPLMIWNLKANFFCLKEGFFYSRFGLMQVNIDIKIALKPLQ